MTFLRIIGDVHAQIERDDMLSQKGRPYLEIIAGTPYSVQIGDLGDAQTYEQLNRHVDPTRHRFLAGNHESYDQLPPHALGDFGTANLGGVDFFFVRGAASEDREKLLELGRKLGRVLWYEQEELSDHQMGLAEQEYLACKPEIVLSHDGPTEVAEFAWQNAQRLRPPKPHARFHPSRTNIFLERLSDQHAPKLWIFGHHHRDWQYRYDRTQFICLGELSYVDIDQSGQTVLLQGRL